MTCAQLLLGAQDLIVIETFMEILLCFPSKFMNCVIRSTFHLQ